MFRRILRIALRVIQVIVGLMLIVAGIRSASIVIGAMCALMAYLLIMPDSQIRKIRNRLTGRQ